LQISNIINIVKELKTHTKKGVFGDKIFYWKSS